ncbi:LOW QUALITY PROTEIN: hypothetical protein Cgig2_024308 [Carnegiea gigantea]|uniref:Uncharacterized protein n=1 Tax=Carnegiea gigantea TaxID=171969 RepID=A0A9Q1GZ32_9CARY|nr:LOW QUALITY PROTEIN: hypothetical protein Cgig2_024308 [Carnegiea gigantea]
MILDVLDVRLEVALYTEGIRHHGRAAERIRCSDRGLDDNLSPLPWKISQPLPPLRNEPPLAGTPSPSSQPPRPLLFLQLLRVAFVFGRCFLQSLTLSLKVMYLPLYGRNGRPGFHYLRREFYGKQRVQVKDFASPRPWPPALHQPQSQLAPVATIWLASLLRRARQRHLLPGSLRSGLRCTLRALPLLVMKIPRHLEIRRPNVRPTSDSGETPMFLCPLTREPWPSGV